MRSTSRTKPSPRKTKFNNSGGDWLRARAAASLRIRWAPARVLVKDADANFDDDGEGCRLAFLSVPRPPGLRRIPPLPSDAESVQAETCRSRQNLFCEIGNSAQCRPNSAHGSLVGLLRGSVRPVFPAPGNFSPARAGEITLSGGSFVSRGNLGYSPHPIWGMRPLS
jgi:hypothetical protein